MRHVLVGVFLLLCCSAPAMAVAPTDENPLGLDLPSTSSQRMALEAAFNNLVSVRKQMQAEAVPNIDKAAAALRPNTEAWFELQRQRNTVLGEAWMANKLQHEDMIIVSDIMQGRTPEATDRVFIKWAQDDAKAGALVAAATDFNHARQSYAEQLKIFEADRLRQADATAARAEFLQTATNAFGLLVKASPLILPCLCFGAYLYLGKGTLKEKLQVIPALLGHLVRMVNLTYAVGCVAIMFVFGVWCTMFGPDYVVVKVFGIVLAFVAIAAFVVAFTSRRAEHNQFGKPTIVGTKAARDAGLIK